MAWRIRWALPIVPLCLVGCVSTTVTEREVGEPTLRVQLDELPEPPRTDVVMRRGTDSVRFEVTRYLTCRRRELSSVRRVRETTSSVSTGSGTTGGIFGGIGLIALATGGGAAGVTFLIVGGSIIGVSALRSGTKTEELPPEETETSQRIERCHERPLADAMLRVLAGGEAHEGKTDANGNVELSGVAPGPVHVWVDGTHPAHVRQGGANERGAPPAKPVEAPRPVPTPEGSAPPSAPIPLPPPPPPPPGARLPD